LSTWLLPAWLLAADQVPVPALHTHVTDLTQTLSAEQRAALENKLSAFEQRKGSQVAVLLIPTTQPDSIEQFSIRVAEAWKIGRKGVDDGAIVIVAKDDHAVRIEVGRGLEGALNDAVSNRIIRNVIVPQFRNGDYYAGLDEGTTRITQVIDGEVLPEAVAQDHRPRRQQNFPWPLLIFVVLIAGSALRAMLGRLPAAGVTAIGSGFLVWMFMGTMLFALVAAVFAFIFVIGGSGRGGGWSSGPGGFGGGGFGGGFGGGGGGWSGGGGGFGGGGASGRW
jgi:uncharacterized protein